MAWNKYIIALLLAAAWMPHAAADDVVYYLYDSKNSYHQTYVSESETVLRDSIPDIIIRHAKGDGQEKLIAAAGDRVLIISVGAEGAKQAAQYGQPTLNTLITRRTYRSLKSLYTTPVSAIYLDQPVSRYIQLVKVAQLKRDRLTVLIGSERRSMEDELKQQAKRFGMQLKLISIEKGSDIDKLFGSDLLAEDTLLLIPDPEVVNRSTVKPLVLGSYSQGIPLIGYSHALVKAGALMAVYSSLPELEDGMHGVVRNYFLKGFLEEPQYIDDFEVSVNYQLSRALRISLPSEQTLKLRLLEQLR